MTRARERMLRGLAQAADQQPWRCAGCGRAVRPGRGDACACVPQPEQAAQAAQAEAAGVLS